MIEPFMFSHIEKQEDFYILDTKWIPETAKFICVGGKINAGVIKIYELNENRINLIDNFRQNNEIKTCQFLSSKRYQNHFVIGDFDGTLQILNIERLYSIYNVRRAHTEVINAVDTVGGDCYGALEIVTGGSDGNVRVWDPRQKTSPVARFEPNTDKTITTRYACLTVTFGNVQNSTERCICAGYDNGDIKLFDLRTMKIRWQAHIETAIFNIEFDNKWNSMNEISIGTGSKGIYLFDLNKRLPNKQFKSYWDGDSSIMWRTQYLPQNQDVMAGCCDNGQIYLFDLSVKSQRKENSLLCSKKFKISKNSINCFDWNASHKGLAVCGSYQHKINVIVSANLPNS